MTRRTVRTRLKTGGAEVTSADRRSETRCAALIESILDILVVRLCNCCERVASSLSDRMQYKVQFDPETCFEVDLVNCRKKPSTEVHFFLLKSSLCQTQNEFPKNNLTTQNYQKSY